MAQRKELILQDQIWWLLALLAIAPRLFIHWGADFGSRQTQVALTAYWFIKDGINLFYPQLPVFGPPTALPFEFPLFQAIVACIGLLLNLHSPVEVITIARLANFAFYLGCAVVLFKLLEKVFSLSIARVAVLLWLALPFNLYMSSESSIEFCALFWSLLYAYSMWQLLNSMSSKKRTALTIVYGALAFLTKSTTVLCVIPSLLILIYLSRIQSQQSIKPQLKQLVIPLTCIAVPFFIGYAWVLWSDIVKSQNIFAGISLTSYSLKNWNCGTFSQRMCLYTWQKLFSYFLGFEILGFVGIPLVLVGLLPIMQDLKKFLWVLPTFIALLTFTNLYFVHSYYFCAIVPYILIPLAVGIDQLISWLKLSANQLDVLKSVTAIIVALLIWRELFAETRPALAAERHTIPYYAFVPFMPVPPASKQILTIADIIKSHSRPDDWILITGDNWSSQIPLYSERRAIMFPQWLLNNPDRETLTPLRINSRAWLEVRKLPIKLFVQADRESAQRDCPFAQPDPSCTIAQSDKFWIGRRYKDNYDRDAVSPAP
jgi:hypothetical protein